DKAVEPRERTNLGYALYRAHDKAGDPARAMEFLRAANRVRAESDPYDMDGHEAVLRQLMDAFRAGVPPLTQAEIADIPAPARPVFIVGMPRSGTSLVEQILASHSDVHGAGELRTLSELLHGFGWDPGMTPRPFDRDTLRALRRGYFEHLERIGATDKPVVTDKTPLNFRHVAPALAAMPEARVLFMRRDARATCWSNFSNSFLGRANNFGNTMAHTARMYRLHLEFLDLWSELFPDRVTMVPYERLTEDQEAESRKLVAAAGLEWQEACLEFHKTKRAVRTVSSAQVKQKMYTGSSQAWRRYEPYLGEMIEALGGIDADN
ncbi:MAG TPA: sulfotransferase, partial [Aliiroseovarius sp.]|nr:sulfotransferase [Aliiroseovarius sp.]